MMDKATPPRLTLSTLFAFLLLTIGTLAAGRIFYELFFPRLLWLGRPFFIIPVALLVAGLVAWQGSRGAGEQGRKSSPLLLRPLAPLLLNLLYLFNPTVDLVQSRLIFFTSLWLMALLWVATIAPPTAWRKVGTGFLLAALLPVYLLTMPATVGRADTFEFQVVAPQLGIAHPTGYPLYLLLGKLFTLLPLESVAWRLNVATMVYGLAAVGVVYLIGLKLGQRLEPEQLRWPLSSLFAAVALGLTPTFWSQAIEAEVYTLHGLVVAVTLWQIFVLIEQGSKEAGEQGVLWLAATIGVGLTNHLTTVFLLPPAGLAVLLVHWRRVRAGQPGLISVKLVGKTAVFFLLPLLLYAYLPLRWLAVNGEPMGVRRFVDWVIGGRFQNALQWGAWLHDPTRYEVVGRLLLSNWGWVNLLIAVVGLGYLLICYWEAGLLLLVTWLGFTFYALNYYVPDLAVFLLPAHLVVAIWWGVGGTAILAVGSRVWRVGSSHHPTPHALLPTILFLPLLLPAPAAWRQVDRSGSDGLTAWGVGVLNQPLAANAAILADSEKIAPLYYLQQAEGMRPDLDIMVLPDEAAYRAELDGRLAAGQTVYLARFLPGLEGIYHLRSAGPLTEVSTQPLTSVPPEATPADLTIGPLSLLGYTLEPVAAVDETATAVTFYWQASQPVGENVRVYIRWHGGRSDERPLLSTGQHPANDDYPTIAWDAGEIVPDYHLLPQPLSHQPQDVAIQVALAPAFTPAASLDWRTVTTLTLPPTKQRTWERPLRLQIGTTTLTSAHFPSQIRPQIPLPIQFSGFGPANLTFNLQAPNLPISQSPNPQSPIPAPFTTATTVSTGLENGRYTLTVQGDGAICGWLARPTNGCPLGKVEISGVALPPDATNFDDKIALLGVDLGQTELVAGTELPVTLTWQSLAPLDHDYTVFIQILNDQDHIVGQVDAWPLQGTLPTSQWQPGQTITDPHLVRLADDLPPGNYRLQVGWYLLATLQRLPVLDSNAAPIDDKFLVTQLAVSKQ